jgi:hypothetical protein
MNRIIKRKGYWIGGATLGLLGVAAVRLIAPELTGLLSKCVLIAGYLMALGGIFLITAGIKS